MKVLSSKQVLASVLAMSVFFSNVVTVEASTVIESVDTDYDNIYNEENTIIVPNEETDYIEPTIELPEITEETDYVEPTIELPEITEETDYVEPTIELPTIGPSIEVPTTTLPTVVLPETLVARTAGDFTVVDNNGNVVSNSVATLQEAVDLCPANTPYTIKVNNDIVLDDVVRLNGAYQDIKIMSADESSPVTITQSASGTRHFYSYNSSTLTIENITLTSTAENAGGINIGLGVLNINEGVNFVNNANEYSGGAIYGYASQINIASGVSFDGNSASKGGAIFTGYESGINIASDVTFLNNDAEHGSAIFSGEGLLVIADDVLFYNNGTESSTSVVCATDDIEICTGEDDTGRVVFDSNNGFAVSIDYSVLNMKNTDIVNGDGAIVAMSSSINLENCEISNNSADNYIIDAQDWSYDDYGCSVNINNTKIINNGDLDSDIILNLGDATANITNSEISGNQSKKSTIYTKETDVSISNSKISDNIVDDESMATVYGALYAKGMPDSYVDILIKDTEFLNNGNGGAIEISFANCTIDGSDISKNHTDVSGGAITATYSDIDIKNSTISDNSTEQYGAISASFSSNVKITDSDLSGNSSRYGGAIALRYNSDLEVTNSNLKDNSATEGGAIYDEKENDINLINVNLSNNSADLGGAIYVGDYSKYYKPVVTSTYKTLFIDSDTVFQDNSSSQTYEVPVNYADYTNFDGKLLNNDDIAITYPVSKVTYHSNDGTDRTEERFAPTDYSYVVESTLFNEEDKFFVWTTEPDFKGQIVMPNATVLVSKDVDLYANEINFIIYDTNDENHLTSSYVINEDNYEVLEFGYENPNGDIFIGYNTSPDGTGQMVYPGDIINSSTGLPRLGTMDLYISDYQTRASVDDATLYLYAQWSTPYTVTYESNFEELGNFSEQTYSTNPLEEYPTYLIKNNMFDYSEDHVIVWNTEADGSGDLHIPGQELTLTEDITLYAQAVDLVVYDSNDENNLQQYATIEHGSEFIVESFDDYENPNGDVFIGFNTKRDGSGHMLQPGDKIDTAIIEDMISGGIKLRYAKAGGLEPIYLYAQWSTPYTVTYDPNDSGMESYSEVVYSEDPMEEYPTYLIKYGILAYPDDIPITWSTEPDGSGDIYISGEEITLTEDITLYAQLKNVVIYDSNDIYHYRYYASIPHGADFTTERFTYVTPEENVFIGYNTKEDGSGVMFKPGELIENDGSTNVLYLYAQWSTPYTVTYDPNDSDMELYSEVVYSEDPMEEYPTYLIKHGILDYPYDIPITWSTEPDGSGDMYISGEELTLTEDITLYAQLKEVVIYESNDLFDLRYYASLPYGEDFIVDSFPKYEHPLGYEFMSYNTKSDGTGTAFEPGDVIENTEDFTVMYLYAQWDDSGIDPVDPTEPEGPDEPTDPADPTDPQKPVEPEKPELIDTENHVVYLIGYEDATVRPNKEITRAEMATIFYRLLEVQGEAETNTFSDVDSSAWYANYVNYLAELGILNGYEDGTFKPEEGMTRAEFVSMISRFYTINSANGTIFSDVSSSHWAYLDIDSVYNKGLINGYPDGTFRPESPITRAETSAIINRMIGRDPSSETIENAENPYSDITPEYWSYEDIMEASISHEYIINENGEEIWQ